MFYLWQEETQQRRCWKGCPGEHGPGTPCPHAPRPPQTLHPVLTGEVGTEWALLASNLEEAGCPGARPQLQVTPMAILQVAQALLVFILLILLILLSSQDALRAWAFPEPGAEKAPKCCLWALTLPTAGYLNLESAPPRAQALRKVTSRYPADERRLGSMKGQPLLYQVGSQCRGANSDPWDPQESSATPWAAGAWPGAGPALGGRPLKAR